MNKFILPCLLSMLTCICNAQYSRLLHPALSNLVFDPQNIVTDFSYNLKANSKVHLQWKVKNIEMVDFFSIERSANGRDFEMIEILKLLAANSYELIDESPLPGKSFYRIRTSTHGKPVYSPTLTVYRVGETALKFYPNPADNILIVRSEFPLDVQIADGTGEVRISQLRVQGLQTINVSALEKGIYMIRFTNKAANTVTIEKLFKN
ncbi:MAG: T9SS type A sorting domain-containing protein [Flavitalea sp.]